MALQKFLLGLLLWCGMVPSLVRAHVDPSGDIHPWIQVRDGKFVVTFAAVSFWEAQSRPSPHTQIVYSPDGTVLVPRHRIESYPESFPYPESGRSTSLTTKATTTSVGKHFRFVLVRSDDHHAPREEPLPLPAQDNAEVEATNFVGPLIGFTWTSYSALPGFPGHRKRLLHLAHVEAGLGREGSTVCIGEPAKIYHFPTASSPVWAGGKWWVAWVREAETTEERKNPVTRWRTVFSSYDPVTKVLRHKVINELSDWNTKVDLKTTGGWLCAAWHASKDGTYPGEAKICTAFLNATDP